MPDDGPVDEAMGMTPAPTAEDPAREIPILRWKKGDHRGVDNSGNIYSVPNSRDKDAVVIGNRKQWN